MAKASKLQNFLLYLFFFSLNFEIWDPLNTNGNFSVAKFTGFLYAFSLIPKLQYFFTTHKSIIIYARMLLILYVFICIMNFINMNYFSSDFLFFSFFQNILLFLLVISHERLSPGVLEKGFIVFFFGSLVLAACFYLGIGLEVNIEGRVSLFGDNENIIGVRMVVSALMLTHILLKYRNKVSKFIYTILPLAYIPLVTLTLNTGSRLSFISLFLGISVIFILYKNRGTFSKILILGIGVIAAVFLFEIAMESEVLGARLAKTGEEGNLAGRDNIWLAILPLIENNWILGVGRTGYIEYSYSLFGEIKSPHNVILEIIAYSGVVGLSLFMSILFRAFWGSFRYYKLYNEVIPFVFIVPISGIILSAQILTLKLGWIILAFVASRILYLKKST